MLDIELTLRRELPTDGEAIIIKHPVDAATRRSSQTKAETAEGVPPASAEQALEQPETKPRVKARVVTPGSGEAEAMLQV